MVLDLNGEPLPFNFNLSVNDANAWVMAITNGEEVIHANDLEVRDDSIFIRMPLYDSEFRGSILSMDSFSGHWINHTKGPEYKIDFIARAGEERRFIGQTIGKDEISGTWEVHFSHGSEKAYGAIGVFEQDPEGRVTGTFITETGDHRYLEGALIGDSLKLSAFDGSHAFLYTALKQGDRLEGVFRSGIHWQEPWVGWLNPDFELRDPDSLTTLAEGYSMVDFSFPDLDGRMVSPDDPQFKGKPLLIQVMGSWCPNCVDETLLLNELHEKYNSQGLEVIAVAFEKHEDPEKAINVLRRFKRTLNVRYPILYGGRASKEVAAKKLPFLNHVMSYPTCIYVDHTGTVRRIRTGYYGPGTGAHHARFRREIEGFVEQLVRETTNSRKAALRQ
jgi:thiol-disulfide isomerase/thioredoxin